MELMTAQMGRRFEAKRRNYRFIDTTVKTSNRLFAPTWDMVLGVKSGEVSEEDYTKRYRRILIDSWVNRREEWMEVLRTEGPVVIGCYCPAGQFCHRLLLKDFLEELCKKLELPFEYYGELT